MTEERIDKPTKEEKLAILRETIKNVQEMPQNALLSPLNHYDLLSILILVQSLFEDV